MEINRNNTRLNSFRDENLTDVCDETYVRKGEPLFTIRGEPSTSKKLENVSTRNTKYIEIPEMSPLLKQNEIETFQKEEVENPMALKSIMKNKEKRTSLRNIRVHFEDEVQYPIPRPILSIGNPTVTPRNKNYSEETPVNKLKPKKNWLRMSCCITEDDVFEKYENISDSRNRNESNRTSHSGRSRSRSRRSNKSLENSNYYSSDDDFTEYSRQLTKKPLKVTYIQPKY